MKNEKLKNNYNTGNAVPLRAEKAWHTGTASTNARRRLTCVFMLLLGLFLAVSALFVSLLYNNENTGRDGSPVGSASPLADTENGDVSAVNLNVYWTSTAVSTSATFTDHHLQPPISTNSLIVGESTDAALMSVSRSSSGGFSNAATRTLFSLSMEVPAYTRYSVPLKVETYSRGCDGPWGSQIGSYVYSMGTDPNNVPGTYYTVGNSPSQYTMVGSHISNWVGKSSVSDSKQNTFYFQNLTGKTQTVTYYFYAGVCSIKFNRWMCYGTIGYARLTVTETPTMQRLVPTSYDVEYDQLRHSLEEEYYEAIRLDENYPTRQVPLRFVPMPCAV